MIPWSIALLSLFYAVIATASAASVWRVIIGVSHQSFLWPVGWLLLSLGAMCGLALLKSWGRNLAILGFLALIVVTLAVAGLLVMAREPLGALLATTIVSLHVLAIRYLCRPAVKVWFQTNAVNDRATDYRLRTTD